MLWLGEEVVVEWIGTTVFEDEIEFSLGLDDFDEPGDGGMGELSQDVDFPL